MINLSVEQHRVAMSDSTRGEYEKELHRTFLRRRWQQKVKAVVAMQEGTRMQGQADSAANNNNSTLRHVSSENDMVSLQQALETIRSGKIVNGQWQAAPGTSTPRTNSSRSFRQRIFGSAKPAVHPVVNSQDLSVTVPNERYEVGVAKPAVHPIVNAQELSVTIPKERYEVGDAKPAVHPIVNAQELSVTIPKERYEVGDAKPAAEEDRRSSLGEGRRSLGLRGSKDGRPVLSHALSADVAA